MEFIGRRVRKAVGVEAAFCGYVSAFEPETSVFKIVYDDGDLVEVDLSELHKLLEPRLEVVREVVSGAVEVAESPRKRSKSDGEGEQGGEGNHLVNAGGNSDDLVARDVVSGAVGVGESPRKRSKSDGEGDHLMNAAGDLVAEGGGSGVLCLNLNEGLDLNGDYLGKFDNGDNGSVEVVGGGVLHGLDLNDGVNVELNGHLINDVEAEKSAEGKKEVIDLNVDVNEDEDLEGDRKRRRFDLNIELPENDGLGVDEQMREEFPAEDCDRGHNLEKKEENLFKDWDSRVENKTVAAPVSLPRRRGRKRKAEVDSNVEIAPEMRLVDVEAGNVEVESESRDETPSKGCDESVSDVNVVSGSAPRGRRARKKKEVLGNSGTIMATPDTGLRRSSRRAKSAVLFGHDNAAELDGTSHQLPPPTISALSDKKVTGAARFRAAQCTVLPPKVELPCPSSNLDLHGVSPFDFLSVYAFLRSFSTFLFLSPFEIDDFVESVKCTDSTLLFDSVHVALLRILRKHLQSLSNQGSLSATNCLRSLNWDFLDLITWPMFVTEYLLLHNPGYIPGLDLRQSKPFKSSFYKLPVSVKVEILRHLCDDVIETEVFRAEINKRMSGMDRDVDLEQNRKFDSSRKRKALIDVASTSCVTEDDVQEDADGNSDECCLCKMDGNLICCDGCPAAYHARCVGVVCSVLPEGDWYCPECLIGKDNPWLKMGKFTRGADLLGIDPYGRRYYSTCGYLLVSESCEDKHLYWSYNINDIPMVVEALESPPSLYEAITRAISKHWNIIQGVGGSRNDMDSQSYCMDGVVAGKRPSGKSMVASYSCNMDLKIGENITAVLETGNFLKTENQVASSEGSAEVSQASTKIDNLKDSGSESLRACPEIHDDAHIMVDTGNHNLTDIPLDVAQCNDLNPVNYHGANYVNYYQFAYEASLLHEGLASKSSGKISEDAPKSIQDIVAGQVKAISNRFSDFSWSNIQNSSMNHKKEKCGWCFHCQVPEMEKECLLIAKTSIPAVESFSSEALGFGLRKNRENHLVDVMCHMICIEHHLHGLLLGPWSNAHHSMLWRSNVAGADDIASLKYLLLMMESNLHRLAFSAEWRKHVDSVTTMGSAYHIVRNYPRAPQKLGIERRTGNRAGLSLFWWRGGTGSRKLFNWKALPHSLASKAARQGGLRKIPGVLYPESGDIAKRTKCDVWRAAVESSRSVDQLAIQIRELDACIKWDEIWNVNCSLKMDKNSKKSVKSFKKAVIRKKSSTGSVARYLLDFGKRRTSYIPDVVLQHGTLLDDPSSDRKKYWLEESFVPLHLMKVFEEKIISRKSNKLISSELREIGGTRGKPIEKKGFAYLFSKAESLAKYQCGHCKKDVLVREAVSCEHCKGYFHKKHVRKASGSVVGECVYTCHKCFSVVESKGDGTVQKSNNAPKGLKRLRSGKGKNKQKGKRLVQSENKKADRFVVPLRRSARYAERIVKLTVQTTKVKHKKRGRKPKAAKGKSRKIEVGGWKSKNTKSRKIEVGGWKSKKTRSTMCSSYWLKGLQFSKRLDDERLLLFKRTKLIVLSGEATSRRKKPACCLCGELEYSPQLNYLACEACRAWFHGDALDLSADKIEKLIGFKCHRCLDKRIPVCPHSYPAGSSKSKLVADFNLETGCSEEDL